MGFALGGGGCVAIEGKIVVPAGDSSWRPPDTRVATSGEHARTARFAIDRVEVTWARYLPCVAAGGCVAVSPLAGGDPGQAVHGVTRDEAAAFCRWTGGRLPSDAEWLRAALGDVETRYPWGDPDVLCMRASFGLVNGPCARGGRGPDTAGARPWGATPTGILDLAGNVAEWVDTAPAATPGGAHEGVVRGGSFAEDGGPALRARWRRVLESDSRLPWVGFRCAYDAPGEAGQ